MFWLGCCAPKHLGYWVRRILEVLHELFLDPWLHLRSPTSCLGSTVFRWVLRDIGHPSNASYSWLACFLFLVTHRFSENSREPLPFILVTDDLRLVADRKKFPPFSATRVSHIVVPSGFLQNPDSLSVLSCRPRAWPTGHKAFALRNSPIYKFSLGKLNN